jgi:hypothetical protein
LLLALFVILKPINGNLALLAAFSRLAESAIFALIILNDFVVLQVLSDAENLRAFDTQQLQALAYTFIRVHDAGYLIGLVFFGLGSTVFAYLWFKSRYIPPSAGRLGDLLVVGGGSRHFGHHGVPQFGGRRDTGLLCADFYLRLLAAC